MATIAVRHLFFLIRTGLRPVLASQDTAARSSLGGVADRALPVSAARYDVRPDAYTTPPASPLTWPMSTEQTLGLTFLRLSFLRIMRLHRSGRAVYP